jgi:hypothetical protein
MVDLLVAVEVEQVPLVAMLLALAVLQLLVMVELEFKVL